MHKRTKIFNKNPIWALFIFSYFSMWETIVPCTSGFGKTLIELLKWMILLPRSYLQLNHLNHLLHQFQWIHFPYFRISCFTAPMMIKALMGQQYYLTKMRACSSYHLVRDNDQHNSINLHDTYWCSCLSVFQKACVCEREREGEKECVCVRERERKWSAFVWEMW